MIPSVSITGSRRQARLADARLYVVTDARRDQDDLEPFLRACVAGSTDILQLRDKTATPDELRRASEVFRRVCDDAGALFVLNDLPGLAAEVGADGVHVGQEDVHPDHARRIVGPDVLIGRSTHGTAQLDAAADVDVDYVAVGPVHATPTKQGRPAIGLDPVRYAARYACTPWFAIGGIDQATIGQVLDAGARRIVVVRAMTGASDPEAAAWVLRRALAAQT